MLVFFFFQNTISEGNNLNFFFFFCSLMLNYTVIGKFKKLSDFTWNLWWVFWISSALCCRGYCRGSGNINKRVCLWIGVYCGIGWRCWCSSYSVLKLWKTEVCSGVYELGGGRCVGTNENVYKTDFQSCNNFNCIIINFVL